MRVITAGSNKFIVELSQSEMSRLTGINFEKDYYYTNDLRTIENKEFDLRTQLEKMHALQCAFEQKRSIVVEIDKIKKLTESLLWPAEEIVKEKK